MLTNKSTCNARGTKELPAVNRGYDTRAGKIKNLCFLLPEGPPFLYVKEKEEKKDVIRKVNFQGNLENHEFTLAATKSGRLHERNSFSLCCLRLGRGN